MAQVHPGVHEADLTKSNPQVGNSRNAAEMQSFTGPSYSLIISCELLSVELMRWSRVPWRPSCKLGNLTRCAVAILSETLALWQCHTVVLWQCHAVALWQCHTVSVSHCGIVVVWHCVSHCGSVERTEWKLSHLAHGYVKSSWRSWQKYNSKSKHYVRTRFKILTEGKAQSIVILQL